MSDVVVSVVESNTAVTVTEQDVAVDVTENNVVVSVSTAGIQGVPGANNDPTYVTVRNATGATLAKGTIVYISGANGNNVQVTPAIATGDSTSARTLGWLAADILNNGSGLCMVEGYLEGINTQGFTAGAQLYLSGTTAGAFTATKPVAPIHLVYVGVVTKVSAGDGHVFVKVQNGYEISELHDVLIVAPTNNQVLAYDSATQLWKNATNTPDGVTSITATAPLTGGTITSTGSIGLDQTALSITKSQVSDFTSGTVTSAGTAQQAGTAVYAVNSGTAVYATTSGTAVSISGDITKSRVSDFTSGTVASAGTAQQAGTAVFANTSGTATYATTSGTATYADTSGTATFATNSGTAVFATNASTAVTISGSIAQSQVTNLTTDLAGKANLAGGNAFTEAQTILGTVASNKVLEVKGASGQSASFFEVLANAGNTLFRVNATGYGMTPLGFIGGGTTMATNARNTLYTAAAASIGLVIQGAASQTADLFQAQTSDGSVRIAIDSTGRIVSQSSANLGGFPSGLAVLGVRTSSATTLVSAFRGAASQLEDLVEYQTDAGTTLGGRNANAQIFTGSTAPLTTSTGGATTATSGTGSVATVSTSSAHNLANGDRVTIAGITPTGYNGTYIVTVVSAFSFSYANATTGAQTVAGTVRIDAQSSSVSRSAATVGLLVRGATSQASNIFEVQNSSGNTLASVAANGSMLINGIGITTGDHRVGTVSYFSAALNVQARTATEVGQVIRGAASQTADLLQVQNSAASNLLRIDSGGNLKASNVATLNSLAQLAQANSGGVMIMGRATAQFSSPGANSAALYFRDGTIPGTLKLVVRAGAAGAETTILDNIPQ